MKSTTEHLIERAADRLRRSSSPELVAVLPVPGAAIEEGLPRRQEKNGPASPVEPTSITLEALRSVGLAATGERSRVVEEWRVIANALLRAQPAAGRRLGSTLMVTSSQPAEGKSFCSLNLAATVALTSPRAVILIDLDYKPRSLSGLLGLAEHEGLVHLVRDPDLDLSRIVLATAIDRFHIVPLGRLLDDRAHGVGVTEATIAALESIARRYRDHLIVLDMPPCLATSDATSLAPYVGQIAMIVEAGRTQRTELETAVSLLDSCPVTNLVLNKCRTSARGHFGGNYYGYYGDYGER